MESLFTRAAVLGLGLMGGSLGLALRDADAAGSVVGYDVAPGVAERARERGAVDTVAGAPEEAVAGADLVVLAAPVLAERALLRAIAPHVAPEALVTDLGSTKEQVVTWAAELLPNPARFVGGHPMTGRERSGIDAAAADLYQDAVWCLTPTATTDPTALARLTALALRLGATPRIVDPGRHDWLVAGVSHLPLVIASTLVRTLGESSDWPELGELAAGGFRDTTRVAAGSPIMARDICLSNGPAIITWLDAYSARLSQLRERIAAGDEALLDDFTSARALRAGWSPRRQHEAGT